MSNWSQSLPRLWETKHSETTFSTSSFHLIPSYGHDIFVANYWNYQRLFHVQLHEALAFCWIFLSRQASSDERTELRAKMRSSQEAAVRTIEENLATIPFLTGVLDCDGRTTEMAAPTDDRANFEPSKDLGLWFAYMGIRPIMESPMMTLEQRARAKDLLTEILQQLRRVRGST
ncbi:MAG: hypothetical protein M1821_007067 [Bathelium mastoideum]|nr:MAG: hypothetical protein M1821_007067 [Bathelium mastoideum]